MQSTCRSPPAVITAPSAPPFGRHDVVSRLYYIRFMKTSLLPPVRVSEELRAAVEGVLVEGETLSSFIQQSVERAVEYRRVQADFHSRGQAALERYKRTGRSHAAAEVVAALQAKLDRKRKQLGR